MIAGENGVQVRRTDEKGVHGNGENRESFRKWKGLRKGQKRWRRGWGGGQSGRRN